VACITRSSVTRRLQVDKRSVTEASWEGRCRGALHHCCARRQHRERPPHVVQAVARHADVKFTLKVYAHANLDEMRQALGKLDGRLQ
jgi:integrase